MKQNSFPRLLHAFFHEWAGQQRNLSHHTVKSYRDTWRLFLRFVSERKKRAIDALSLADFDAREVSAFLQYLEDKRKVSVGTRNCRLGALHSFFAFAARQEPLALAQCAEIASIPVKKTSRPDRPRKDSAIMHCFPSSTTPEHASRKLSTSLPRPSGSNRLPR